MKPVDYFNQRVRVDEMKQQSIFNIVDDSKRSQNFEKNFNKPRQILTVAYTSDSDTNSSVAITRLNVLQKESLDSPNNPHFSTYNDQ